MCDKIGFPFVTINTISKGDRVRHMFDIGIFIFYKNNLDNTCYVYEDLDLAYNKYDSINYFILPEYRLIKYNISSIYKI